MDLTVSVGHGEYLPAAAAGLTATLVWDPYDEANLDHTETPDAALERYREVVGAEPTDDFDLTWETIQRWTGTAADFGAALDSLLAKLAETPSGDDDTFDYWPSGVRLALQVAEALGRTAEVERVAREAIAGTGLEEEVLARIGLE